VAGFSRLWAVLAGTGNNPVTGYDHRIPVYTFLLFYGVFYTEMTTFSQVLTRNPLNRGPESLSWEGVILFFKLLTLFMSLQSVELPKQH
jgi:hypothetical protein